MLNGKYINWLPLVKKLSVEQFILSGDVSRYDLMQLIELPLKNKCITSFIKKGINEKDNSQFKQLFVDNGQ